MMSIPAENMPCVLCCQCLICCKIIPSILVLLSVCQEANGVSHPSVQTRPRRCPTLVLPTLLLTYELQRLCLLHAAAMTVEHTNDTLKHKLDCCYPLSYKSVDTLPSCHTVKRRQASGKIVLSQWHHQWHVLLHCRRCHLQLLLTLERPLRSPRQWMSSCL